MKALVAEPLAFDAVPDVPEDAPALSIAIREGDIVKDQQQPNVTVLLVFATCFDSHLKLMCVTMFLRNTCTKLIAIDIKPLEFAALAAKF